MSRTHLVIPDVQDRPGAPKDHLRWIGNYIVEQKPDVVINIGDFADMESLCEYDRGKISFEGRRYNKDIDSAKEAMRVLLAPMKEYNEKCRKDKKRVYKPEMHLLVGNHEFRVNKLIDQDPRLEGTVSIDDLEYDKNWLVHDFLVPIEIDGISYSHYFYRPKTGHPYSGMVETRLKNIGKSFTQGHEQGKLIGSVELFDGTIRRGLVVGSCYLYEPVYRGPQAQSDWRGIILKHEVQNGNYDLMEVSLDYLCRKYEDMNLKDFLEQKYGLETLNVCPTR